ncbi:glycosyltransferase, partial [Singulisphaera rosea]
FGNVVLEAMSSGLPVVALRAGGISDIVQSGRTGFLIDPDRPTREFADALLPLVDHANLRRGISEEARAYALNQSWDAIMGALRERYLRAIESSTHAASSRALAV